MRTTAHVFRTVGIATVAAVIGAGALGAATASAALPLPTTTTTLASSQNPSVAGDLVTFTATVTQAVGSATGTVQFLEAGAPLSTVPLVGGTAAYATSALPVGSHDVVASYVPDPLNPLSLPSVSTVLTQVVNAATGGGGGGGGGGGICLPGQSTPTPTISAPARVVGPHAVTIRGTAAANDPVDLYQQLAGSSAISKVGSTTASAGGAYSFTRNVSKQTAFAVQDRGACGTKTSAPAVTKVALGVVLTLTSPHKGKLRMRATTAPRVANQLARFYRVKKGGTRVLLAKVATGANGSAHKTVSARSHKRYRVIAIVSAPPGNLAGTSKQQAVTVR